MKTFFTILTIFSMAASFPQQFRSLHGMENQNGETILTYRLGEGYFSYTNIFKFNTVSGTEEQIMTAYYNQFPGGELAKGILDYQFFPGDTENFMNVGYEINPDNHGFIARNDTIIHGSIESFTKVEISKQNPELVFVNYGGYGLMKSYDAGNTWSNDSIISFGLISLSPLNHNIMFGTDYTGDLLKSTDGGITYSVVDTLKVFNAWWENFLYDVNHTHIYRTTKRGDKYFLSVSYNNGNAFTWQKKYESFSPIHIALNNESSGTIYLADGRHLFISSDYGNTFTKIRHFETPVIGIYKKPGSDILYIGTRYKLYKLENDELSLLKLIPAEENDLSYYPLKIGNTWIYSVTSSSFDFPPYYEQYYMRRKVVDIADIGDMKYYKIGEETSKYNSLTYYYERIDSLEGKVYQVDSLFAYPDYEKLIEDLRVELNDTIYTFRFNIPDYPVFSVVYETGNLITDWGDNVEYFSIGGYDLVSWDYKIAKGYGLHNLTQGYCFGYTTQFLVGGIINGGLFGDTTFIVSADDSAPLKISSFELYQNYPNPFNPSTRISWQSPVGGWQTLKVYDVLGNEVSTLVNEYKPAGSYEIKWDATGLSSGIYFYRITIGSFTETKKMILLR